MLCFCPTISVFSVRPTYNYSPNNACARARGAGVPAGPGSHFVAGETAASAATKLGPRQRAVDLHIDVARHVVQRGVEVAEDGRLGLGGGGERAGALDGAMAAGMFRQLLLGGPSFAGGLRLIIEEGAAHAAAAVIAVSVGVRGKGGSGGSDGCHSLQDLREVGWEGLDQGQRNSACVV